MDDDDDDDEVDDDDAIKEQYSNIIRMFSLQFKGFFLITVGPIELKGNKLR